VKARGHFSWTFPLRPFGAVSIGLPDNQPGYQTGPLYHQRAAWKRGKITAGNRLTNVQKNGKIIKK
jgi:hypothetical protein